MGMYLFRIGTLLVCLYIMIQWRLLVGLTIFFLIILYNLSLWFYDLFLVKSSFCLSESDLNNVSLVSHSLSGTSEFIVAHVKCLKCSRFVVHYPKRYFVCTRSSRFVSDKISLDFRYLLSNFSLGSYIFNSFLVLQLIFYLYF